MARNSGYSDGGDQWSGDFNFIQNIDLAIKIFAEALFMDNFEQMFNSLQFLEIITSPEIDHDDVEKNLEWLELNLQKYNIVDGEGNVLGFNPMYKLQVKKIMRDTLRKILIKLEQRGIYTRKGKDPSHAMGQFSSS